MSLRLQTLLDAPIIELDTIDSTNNYAMRLIDADTAQPGLTVISREQTMGKGQRGKQWESVAGESLLASIVTVPPCSIDEQFVFSAAVAVGIAGVLSSIWENWDVKIKWPNDIIINDKKAGGILIENILRGNNWYCSIVGLGLNIRQTSFPAGLPYATSLMLASGRDFSISSIFGKLREGIFERTLAPLDTARIMKEYNDYLYRKDQEQKFTDGSLEWHATVIQAGKSGLLEVQLADGDTQHYSHGVVHWKWD